MYMYIYNVYEEMHNVLEKPCSSFRSHFHFSNHLFCTKQWSREMPNHCGSGGGGGGGGGGAKGHAPGKLILPYYMYVYCTSWNFHGGFISRISRVEPSQKFPLQCMSIYSNDNISKIAKLTTRELPHLAKTAKITVRENNGIYSICIWSFCLSLQRSFMYVDTTPTP